MSGSHHFYTFKTEEEKLATIFVSMPYVGLTSFLPYPFKTSVFMRLSEPVFARIFLNCQIIGYNKNKNWAEYKLYLKNTITDVLRYNHYTLLMTLINC